jgi:hypothetical protein
MCPVCGYDGLNAKAEREDMPSFVTCPCCIFEFGFDDLSVGETYESYRNKWVDAGMPWKGPYAPPEGWNPREQLKRVT